MVSKLSILKCFGCKPSDDYLLDCPPILPPPPPPPTPPPPPPPQQVIERRSFRQPPNHETNPETGWQESVCGHDKRYSEAPHGENSVATMTWQQRNVLAGVEQSESKHTLAVSAKSSKAAAEAARPSSYQHGTGGQSKEEWAALKIQGAFRGFLARRALSALKGLVRLQALFRGHSVRQQTISTLHSMQALLRVQARMRSRRVFNGADQVAQSEFLQKQQQISDNSDPKGWDDSVQLKEEIEARLKSKQVAALKRERALAYAFSHQPWKPELKPQALVHVGWSWLDRWMVAQPWESHGVEGESENKKLKIMESELAMLSSTKKKSPNQNNNPKRRNHFASPPSSFRALDEESVPSLSRVTAGAKSLDHVSTTCATPNYMTVTESAKAKFRPQSSSPKCHPVTPQRERIFLL